MAPLGRPMLALFSLGGGGGAAGRVPCMAPPSPPPASASQSIAVTPPAWKSDAFPSARPPFGSALGAAAGPALGFRAAVRLRRGGGALGGGGFGLTAALAGLLKTTLTGGGFFFSRGRLANAMMPMAMRA